MFNCLTQDSDVYGINEDALGSLLFRLLNSPDKGPHYIEAYLNFMYALRSDRQTLVLKTPSNIRHAIEIKRYLPTSKFIVMIREPHAAVVSGMSRHSAGVKKVARIWLSDYQYLKNLTKESVVINYEKFILQTSEILQEIDAKILPLPPSVFECAAKFRIQENAEANRWRNLVDTKIEKEVEHWVAELHLEQTYRAILNEFNL